MKIVLIEGPLLDRIGEREPEVYGSGFTREDVEQGLRKKAADLKVELEFLSSYSEGELAELVSNTDADGIVINPGAYTHTSVLIRDALLYRNIPFVEAHFSNIFSREEFRKKSFISDIAQGFICGFGINTYSLALDAVRGCLLSD